VNKPFILQGYRPQIHFVISLPIMKYVMSIITVFQVYQICMSLFTFKNVNNPFILDGNRPQILPTTSMVKNIKYIVTMELNIKLLTMIRFQHFVQCRSISKVSMISMINFSLSYKMSFVRIKLYLKKVCRFTN